MPATIPDCKSIMTEMKLLITGAGGFIGRHAVAAARSAGHTVFALVRDPETVPGSWASDPDITVVGLDLLAPDAQGRLAELMVGAEAIIHAAAVMSGEAAGQVRDTVGATDTVLAALDVCKAPQPRLVLVSSMSVYDGQALAANAVLTEDSPLESSPMARDAYCQAKLTQEADACTAAKAQGFELWILRPGAVFGPGRLWNGHLGYPLGPVLIQMASAGDVPVSFVEHTAQALVLAATTPAKGVEILNVIDDDLPDRSAYVAALRRGSWPQFVLPLNWRLLAAIGRILQKLPGVSGKIPGLLSPATLHARMKPFRYDNTRLRTRFDVPPQMSFAQVMAQVQGQEKEQTQ